MITVLGSMKDCNFFRGSAGYNVCDVTLSIEENRVWLKEAFDRGDSFLILPCDGERFLMEISWLCEFLQV